MHKITLTNRLSCVDLEQQLGLSRGAVKQIVKKADGDIDVMFDKEPTADQKAALQTVLNKIIKD